MPGIVGLMTTRPRAWAEPQLHRMLAAIRHEPFYTSGTWVDEALGVYIGWTAHRDSFAARMPLANEATGKTLVFSGETYGDTGPWAESQARSDAAGPQDPSYLADVFASDRKFPQSLNGRFHGLGVDAASGSAVLFNDRYGMHRLNYHEGKDAFYFAVEAKAILTALPALRQIDERSLGEFVSCGCVLENRTLFRGIFVLPPASRWTFQRGALASKQQYFSPKEWESQTALSDEPYHHALRESFTSALPSYFAGDQFRGMSLTGGLDTRLVLAWRGAGAGALPCYTYGDAYRECRDVRVARRVAAACGLPHRVIPVDGQFLSRFAHYAERSMFLTDACVDVTRAADLYLSERAREIAPVRMTGLYGDEILRPHIRAFKPRATAPDVFDPAFRAHVTAARQTYVDATDCHPLSFAAFRQAPWHHYGALALEQTQLTVRTPFLDNAFVRTAFRAPTTAMRNNDLRSRLIHEGNPVLGRIRTDRGFAGNGSALSSWLAQNYLEFTFKAEYAFDYGMPQWLARVDHLLSPLHLERIFLGRHKLYHYRVWYRDTLSGYVKAMLLDARTLGRPYLSRRGVEAIVSGHLSGGRNYTTEIHRLLSLELIHRLFVDR
jgi:asparagine synthase (glutamine-hydrolysing)